MKYLIFLFLSIFIYGGNEWREIKKVDFTKEDKRCVFEDNSNYKTSIKNGKYTVEIKKDEIIEEIPLKYSLENNFENKISFELERNTFNFYTFVGFKVYLYESWRLILEIDENQVLYVYTHNTEDGKTYYFKGIHENYKLGESNKFQLISNKDSISIFLNDKNLIILKLKGLMCKNLVLYSYGKINYTFDNFEFYQRDYLENNKDKKKKSNIEEEQKEEEKEKDFIFKNV